MALVSIATFNANNFYLRYKFAKSYPGGEQNAAAIVAGTEARLGYLPGLSFGKYGKEQFVIWDATRRELAARALKAPDGKLPDVLCFQEVENIHAIRLFNQDHLGGHYRYSLLIDGYDPRNIDVGVLSRFPIVGARSHIDDREPDGTWVFSRDCLEVEVDIPGKRNLFLVLNHLKSKFARKEAGESQADLEAKMLAGHQRRKAQAQAVRDIVHARFKANDTESLYAVVGDFNDTPLSPWVAPLMSSPRLFDVVSAHRPFDDRWTYWWRGENNNQATQIDYVLGSRALREAVDAAVATDSKYTPHIERMGLPYQELDANKKVEPKQANLIHVEDDGVTPVPAGAPAPSKVDFDFPRFPELMESWRNNVSDHCPVKVWLKL